MSYSLQTFTTTWQRHKAKECFQDCFYCKKARAKRSPILKPRMIVTPEEARRGR